MSLKDADELTPQINLASIINSLSPLDVETDRLIVASPSYMKNLTDILSSTSKEVLQTYFIWKTVQVFASVIEADETKPYSRFSNELQGKVRSSERKCSQVLTFNRIPTRLPSVGGLVSATLIMVLGGF